MTGVICIVCDEKTQTLLDGYADKQKISRSKAIRLIVNNFFTKQTEEKQ